MLLKKFVLYSFWFLGKISRIYLTKGQTIYKDECLLLEERLSGNQLLVLQSRSHVTDMGYGLAYWYTQHFRLSSVTCFLYYSYRGHLLGLNYLAYFMFYLRTSDPWVSNIVKFSDAIDGHKVEVMLNNSAYCFLCIWFSSVFKGTITSHSSYLLMEQIIDPIPHPYSIQGISVSQGKWVDLAFWRKT